MPIINQCRVCGKEFEATSHGHRLCGYNCRTLAQRETEKKRKGTNASKSFSLEQCPYALGLINQHKAYYDELKQFEV